MLGDVFAENFVDEGLPAFAGGFEICEDLGAVAYRDELLCLWRSRASAKGTHRDHHSQLLRRQRLRVRIGLRRPRYCRVFLRRRHHDSETFRYFGHIIIVATLNMSVNPFPNVRQHKKPAYAGGSIKPRV